MWFLGKTLVASAAVTFMAAFPRDRRWLTRDTTLLIHGRRMMRNVHLEGPLGSQLPVRRSQLDQRRLLGSSFQLPAGWASDRFGRKPLIVGGMALAGLVSFAFLLNDQPWYFIALRFLEGAASGAITPAANAYVMDAVPPEERGAAYGWIGASFSAGFMMGPAIGGLMVDAFGYSAPFIVGDLENFAFQSDLFGFAFTKALDHGSEF
jgi:hypothetical protein